MILVENLAHDSSICLGSHLQVFQNERLNGHYGVGAFVIGNTLSSMPFLLLITVISTALIYPIEGLNRGVTHVAYFLFTLYACLLVSEALLMAVSSIVSNFLLGLLVGSGLQVYIIHHHGILEERILKSVFKNIACLREILRPVHVLNRGTRQIIPFPF